MRKVIALLLGGIACCRGGSRREGAQEPLTDAPAIRKRLELRDKRFEFGVGAGVSIGQDFYNALMITPRMAYHFTDWIALGVVGGLNATRVGRARSTAISTIACPLRVRPTIPQRESRPRLPTRLRP